MFRVSSSSSGLWVGTYRCVPLGCPTIRQAVRSLSLYFSQAASTVCRRRSGLTSFPVQYPAGPVSQATGQRQAFLAGRSRSQAASGVWPGPPQGRHTLSASDSSFVLSVPASLQATAIVLPWACNTSIWRSFVTICSAFSLFLAIFLLLSSSILSHRQVQKKPVRSFTRGKNFWSTILEVSVSLLVNGFLAEVLSEHVVHNSPVFVAVGLAISFHNRRNRCIEVGAVR